MNNEMTTDNMSNEEVIDILKGIVFNGFDRTTSKERQALHLAIKALEEDRPTGDLISRSVLKSEFDKHCVGQCNECHYCGEGGDCTLIDNSLTVIAFMDNCGEKCEFERPKGEWKVYGTQGGVPITDCCSNCKYETSWHKKYKNKYNFCPNCGADMRKDEE